MATMYRVTHWGQNEYFSSSDEAAAYVDQNVQMNVDFRASEGIPFDSDAFRREFSISVVERESRACRFCGTEIQADNPSIDYCRNCHYSGRPREEKEWVQIIMSALRTHPRVEGQSVGVWHTGGGCFCVGASGKDGLQILAAYDADVEDAPSAESPWMVCVNDEDDDDAVLVDNLTTVDMIAAAVDAAISAWDEGVRGEEMAL